MSLTVEPVVDYLSSLPRWGLYLTGLSFLGISYILGTMLYNVYLHPLRKYPGPRLWAATRIFYDRAWLSGHGHKTVQELHRRYGEVVRVAPDTLLYSYPEAWDDMMGHRQRGQLENGKEPDFWKDHKYSLIAANREDHARMRKVLSHGFSAQSMMAQQPLIQRYVSLLIERLKERSRKGEVVEMTSWFNWTTFDIIGDLTFGEPFGCLEKCYYHPWIALFFKHIKGTTLLAAARKYPFGETLLKLMMTKKQKEQYNAHLDFTQKSVAKRLAFTKSRPDFMESMARAHENNLMSLPEVTGSAVTLIAGGSETAATALAGAVYLLSTHKDVAEKLANEVRTRFKSEDEIDLLSVQRLEYLLAVIHEVLRLYPVVPAALPRIAPPEGNTIRGQYVPPYTNLGIWQYPLFRNSDYFKDAESFIPERWLDDPRFVNDRKEAMQPFSAGPRNCIGKNLAYAEMRLILARIIWNFDFELDPRSENWIDRSELYLLWEKPDLYIRLLEAKK